MIGKGKAIAHTRASMQYGWNQEKDARVIFSQNLSADSPKEVTSEFRFIQELNGNCKNNTLSFVLSPTIEDGNPGQENALEDMHRIYEGNELKGPTGYRFCTYG